MVSVVFLFDVEKCKEIEKTIKVPLHYVLMGVSVLLIAVFYILTRKSGFFSYISLFVSGYYFMKSVADKKGDEKKWVAFWFLFAFVEMATQAYIENIYISFLKCFALLYLAIFDDCAILCKTIDICCEYLQKGCDWYMDTVCKAKDNFCVYNNTRQLLSFIHFLYNSF